MKKILKNIFISALSVSLFALISFAFVNSADAAAISWDGDAADGEWETNTNWSGDVVPGAADDVTIDMSETIAINGTTTINSLTLGNVNSPVLNFDYDALTSGALIIDDGNLTVGSNATITHTAASTSTVVGTVYIDVQTGNADVDGAIDVEEKGFQLYYGDGAGGGGGGGGHGGYGGGPNSGSTYGSLTAPVELGSGSGGGQSNWSRGGGAIRLTVAGTLDVDAAAVISADGSDNLSWYGPGASGGSVYLDVGTLSGAGTIRADGGGTDQYYYGDGGGGRIAIYYDTDSSSITPTAYGGKKSSDSRANFGGAGTIYMKDNAQSYGDVIIDNNSHHNDSDYELGKTPLPTGTYRSITLSNNGHLVLESGVTLTCTTLTWTDGEITDNGGVLATVTSGDVVVPTDAYLYANTARTGGSALTSLTVNGTLKHSDNTTAETYKIDLETTGNIAVASGGSIDVDSMGYTLGNGPGAGNSNAYGASTGGSYGGQAARFSTDHPATYGSLTAPVNIGSGGGSTSGSGGQGGGAIKLTCGGTLTVTGDITADGGASNDAGGSGGSVYIDTDTITGAGTISANGGARLAGGGGRIAVYYDTSTLSNTPTAYGGYYSGQAERMGGAGTVYLKDNAQSYGDLVIDNNGNDYTESDYYMGKTPLDTATYRNITISNDGHIEIDGSDTITYSSLNWTGGNITDDGATMAVLTGDVTVPAGSRLLANTARSITSLTVNGNLEHSQNITTQDYVVDYTVSGNVTIGATGSIDVSGLGYIQSQGPGAGANVSNVCSGAGHAGTGGDSTTGAVGGAIYDTIDSPDTIGSGGGNRGDYKAADGGGAVKLTVGGDVAIGGDINANAGTDTTWWDWGGSSGGSIWIESNGTCSGSGNLSANGSSGHSADDGAGAGGYIRMMCSVSTWSGTSSVVAGTTGQTAEDGVALINLPPTVTTPTTSVATDGSGEVTVESTIDDSNDDDVKLKVEYSNDGGSTWSDATLSEDPADLSTSTGTPTVENDDTYQIGTTTGIDTTSGANTVSFVWDSATDEPTGDISDAKIRITPADSYVDGSGGDSLNFTVDNTAPTGLALFINTAAEDTAMTFTWSAASDTNFDHYEIWYGTLLTDVQGRTGTAVEWDNGDDVALATATTGTTTITGLGLGNKYYKIWAIDAYGNSQTTTYAFVATGGSESPIVNPPTNVQVADYEEGVVKLSWDDPIWGDPEEGEADKIYIYRGIDPYPVSGKHLTYVDIGTGYFLDSDLEPGDVVTYRLRTRIVDTFSSYTDEITFTVGSTLDDEEDSTDEDQDVDEDNNEDNNDDEGEQVDEDTGSSGGSSGGGGGSSSSNDDDDDDDEDEGDSLDELGISVPEHWSKGYLKNLGEEARVIEEAVQTTSFFTMLMDMFQEPNKGMNRGEALQFLLTLGDYTVTESAVNSFYDVDSSHERGYLIEFAADNDLVQGYPDGSFGPENVVNRAEALKMAAYFFDLDSEELYGSELLEYYGLNENPFVDIDLDAWYAPHVIFAYYHGVVQGYQDGTHRFGPDNDVTYAEFVKIATLMRDFEDAVELASELE